MASEEQAEIYEFGEFRLDVGERKIHRLDGTAKGALPEKAFNTLAYLLRNGGRLISKDELLSVVWPDSIVEENNLGKAIHSIRHFLGDNSADPKLIETVPKHGYRFVGIVRRATGQPGKAGTTPDLAATARPPELPDSSDPKLLDDPVNAFQACQLARYHFQQMTPTDVMKSRSLLELAVQFDPAYAPAYAALAEQSVQEVVIGMRPPSDGYQEANISVQRAFELNSSSVEVFTAAGFVELLSDWNFVGAEQNLRKALDLNPHHAFANNVLGQVFMFQCRPDDAEPFLRKAAELEPMNLCILNLLPISYFLARNYQKAIEECERMLALFPRFIVAAWLRCWALEQSGRAGEAIFEYDRIRQEPHGEHVIRWVGYAYALAGRRKEALETAERLVAAGRELYLSPTHLAFLYAGLNETDAAITFLRQGLEQRDPWMLWIAADPRCDNLRGDPRFYEIAAKVLEKRMPEPDTSAASPHGKRTPLDLAISLPRITESGQHLLLSIAQIQSLAEKLEVRNKPPEAVEAAPEPTPRTVESSDRRIRWIPIAGLIVILLIGGIIGAKLWQTDSRIISQAVSQKRLTVEGGVTRVAISQDGRFAAAAQNAALVLFDLENGTNRVVIPARKDIRIMSIVFRPDGGGLYFGTRTIDQSLVTVQSLSFEGGEPTKILENIYGAPAFSPDGRKIAFVRRYEELNEYALLTANADGSNVNKLATSRLPGRFDAPPAWSPDGRRLVCSMVSVEGGFHFTIANVDIDSGSVKFVPNQRWKSLGAISWLADSRNIVIAGQDEASVNAQVWQADVETGATRRITNDAFVYESLASSLDGRSIVAVKVRQNSHVWMLGDQAVQLTAGSDNYDGFNGLAWAKDGTIFYHSRAMGHDAIWRMKPDGTEAVEITPDAAGGFAISPDGRTLVFQNKQASEHLGLQAIDLETRNERSVTRGITALAPSFFPDGKSLVFTRYDDKLSIHEIEIGGSPQLLNGEFRAAASPEVSPSGKYVAFGFNRVEGANLQSGIAIVESQTKQLVSSHVTRIALGSPYEKSTIRWSTDEGEVYFIQLDNSVSNIMRLRLSDSTVSNLTNFAEGRIFNFAIEPGGRRILVARGFVERDAMLIRLAGGD